MDLNAEPLRIGVIVSPKPHLNESALRSLVLAMNKEQDFIQFEFYNVYFDYLLIDMLAERRKYVDRNQVRDMLPDFMRDLRDDLAAHCMEHELSEDLPSRYVIVSQCRFKDNYFTLREGPCSVLGLGNWHRFMAPPSLLEFVQVLLVREAVAAMSPGLSGSVHLGNKGCLMDFASDLSEARQKVISGYVCHFCRLRIKEDGRPELLDAVARLIDRNWLGSPADPRSPAGVAANLGANLFIVKGLRATAREKVLSALQDEGARQVFVVAGLVIAAVIAALLGVKLVG